MALDLLDNNDNIDRDDDFRTNIYKTCNNDIIYKNAHQPSFNYKQIQLQGIKSGSFIVVFHVNFAK